MTLLKKCQKTHLSKLKRIYLRFLYYDDGLIVIKYMSVLITYLCLSKDLPQGVIVPLG